MCIRDRSKKCPEAEAQPTLGHVPGPGRFLSLTHLSLSVIATSSTSASQGAAQVAAGHALAPLLPGDLPAAELQAPLTQEQEAWQLPGPGTGAFSFF